MAREDVEQGQERPPRRRLGRPVRENGWTQPFDFPQVASWFVFPIFFGVAYVLIGLGIATTMDIEASRSVSTGSNSSNNRNDSSLSAERASSSIPVGAWIAVAVAHFALSVVAFVSAAKTTSSNPMDPSLEPFLARPSEEDCAEEAGRFVQDADAVLCSCLASTKRPPAQNTKQRGVLCCSGGFPGVAQCLSCACIPSDIVLPCSSLLGPGNRGLRHTDLSEGHPRLTRLAENGEEEETYYCPYCRVQVHKTSRHCRICDKCVLDFDHHCKWLNNCIGKRNHAVFVVTVSSLFFLVLSELVIAVMAAVGTDPELNRGWTAQRILGIIYGVFTLVVLAMVGQLFFFHIMLFFRGETTYTFLRNVQLNANEKRREARRKKQKLEREQKEKEQKKKDHQIEVTAIGRAEQEGRGAKGGRDEGLEGGIVGGEETPNGHETRNGNHVLSTAAKRYPQASSIAKEETKDEERGRGGELEDRDLHKIQISVVDRQEEGEGERKEGESASAGGGEGKERARKVIRKRQMQTEISNLGKNGKKGASPSGASTLLKASCDSLDNLRRSREELMLGGEVTNHRGGDPVGPEGSSNAVRVHHDASLSTLSTPISSSTASPSAAAAAAATAAATSGVCINERKEKEET